MNRRRARAVLDRTERTLVPPLRRALAGALSDVREALKRADVAEAVAANDLARALTLVRESGEVGAAEATLRTTFSRSVAAAGKAAFRDIPVLVKGGRKLSEFTIGSPRAAAALGRLELQFFPPVFEQTAATLRLAWTDALAKGVNPRDVARVTRDVVGLTEYDYRIAQSFELQLRGDPATALTRTLRDGRFDATLRTARDGATTLTEAQIRAMTTRYQERLIKWRAETWARTASLNATREAQHAAWLESADAANVPTTDVVKTWVTTLDGRERPEHHDADGTTVPIDQPFPVDGGVQTPGEGVYNCRCTMVVRVAPSGVAQRRAFLAAAERQPRGARESDAALRAAAV